jgi:hypothetical protein
VSINEVLNSAIGGLKGSPILLGLLLLNLIFCGGILLATRDWRARAHDEKMLILKHCLPEARDAN